MENTIDYIKRLDFFSLYNNIPNKNDDKQIAEFCNKDFKKDIGKYLLPKRKEYEPIYPIDEILTFVKHKKLDNVAKSTQDLGRETIESQKDTQAKVKEENFMANLEKMIKKHREVEEKGEIR